MLSLNVPGELWIIVNEDLKQNHWIIPRKMSKSKIQRSGSKEPTEM